MTSIARFRGSSAASFAAITGAAILSLTFPAPTFGRTSEGGARATLSGAGERVAPPTGSRLRQGQDSGSRLRPGFGTGSRLGNGFGTASRIGSARPAERQPVIPAPGDVAPPDPHPPFVHPGLKHRRPGHQGYGYHGGVRKRPAPYLPYSGAGYFGTGRYGLGLSDQRWRGSPTEDVFGPPDQWDPRLGLGPGAPDGVGSLEFPDAPPGAPAPALEPAPPAIGMAVAGVVALRARDYDAAAGVYAGLAALEPDEPEHRRRLALSLLGAGLVEDAGAAMARAYMDAPELAWGPLDVTGLLGGSAETRRLLNRAVAQANRSGGMGVNLLAAVLMQGEGREVPALRMLERAEAAEADADVVAAMRLSLGG